MKLFGVASLAILLLSSACGGGGSGGAGGGGSGGSGGAAGGSGGSGGSGSSGGSGGSGGAAGSGGVGGAVCGPDVDAPVENLGGGVDPEGGVFTLDEALAGLPEGPGPLRAIIETEKGTLTCALFPDDAPNGVANFVGLARGRRPWKQGVSWVKQRFYDGLLFHRVIDDFMAQGGDPKGNGTGGPGYLFPGELNALLHQPGTLAYANTGVDANGMFTNGSQFYITEVKTDWLDGAYTIFGQCEPPAVLQAITAVPTDANDKPIDPIHVVKVTITRCAP